MSKRRKAAGASARRHPSASKKTVSTKSIARSAWARKPTLEEHADAIRALGKQTVETTIKNIIEIGQRLVDVRDHHLDHGEWLPWLKREFAWSRQTADRFIHVYAMRDQIAHVGNLNELPLTALYLLAAPSTPDAVRQQIAARIEAGQKVSSVAEMKEAIEEAKAEDEDEDESQPSPSDMKHPVEVEVEAEDEDEAEAEAEVEDADEDEDEVPKLDAALRSKFYLGVSVLTSKEDRIAEVRGLMRVLGLSIGDFDAAPGEAANVISEKRGE
jgi:DUF3102 family protein